MRCKVKLGNHPSNDLVVQTFGAIEGEYSQPLAKIRGPLTHNVIRCNLLGFKVVACAADNNVVDIGIPVNV